MFDLVEMALGKKVILPSFDDLQKILIKKKLKKSQALSSKGAEESQGKTLEENSVIRPQMEVVEMGGLNSEIPKCGAFVGKKRITSAEETPFSKKKKLASEAT